MACSDESAPVEEPALLQQNGQADEQPKATSVAERSRVATPTSSWLSGARLRIQTGGYRIHKSALATFETLNRRHGFRAEFARDAVSLSSTSEASGEPIRVKTTGWGRTDKLETLSLAVPKLGDCHSSGEVDAEGECLRQLEYIHPGITEWWKNRRSGLEQGWTIEQRPAGAGALIVDLAIEGDVEIDPQGQTARLERNDKALYYDELQVFDADGDELEASMVRTEVGLRIQVDDHGANYPVLIDPTYIAADWSADSNFFDADFGCEVASAGDVNGDGFADIIVGAHNASNGQAHEGLSFVYYGSANGLSATADWSYEIDLMRAHFGNAVSGAGDVNGDGYDDIIAGADFYQNPSMEGDEGAAYIFFGSSSGLSTTPDWMVESNQRGANFGSSVDGAGDVNGDGYDDVIVGARNYFNGEREEGAAFVYYGSTNGPSTTADFMVHSNQGVAGFGTAVAGVGDVNGDGYDDVIVGAPNYDNGQLDEGRAFVYLGAASGPSATAAWHAESNRQDSGFGAIVAAGGDVNGDGFDDVLVGAPKYQDTLVEEGKAYLFFGSANGPAVTPAWTDVGGQANAYFGSTIAAGDFDSDGFDDVVVGAHGYTNGEDREGHLFIYRGSSSGLSPSSTWAAESDQIDARLGWSVSSAGDVDGDGVEELLASAVDYDNGTADEGMVFVYSLGDADTSTCTSPSDCPSGTSCYENPNRCVADPCDGVQCPSGQACYQGTCFETCTDDIDCSNTDHACYDQRCASAPCDGVQCPLDQACYQGTCFETCTDDVDCSNPDHACYDQRCTSDPCDGVQCSSDEACYQGTCFETCVEKIDCTDPEHACYDQRCAAEPCDGVQCPSDETCYQGSCFETCVEKIDCTNPEHVCYDQRCASEPCEGVQCASEQICAEGDCVERCSTDSDCPAGNRCIAGECVVDDSPQDEEPDVGGADAGANDSGLPDVATSSRSATEGCSCRSTDANPAGSTLLALVVLMGVSGMRRRSAKRCQ